MKAKVRRHVFRCRNEIMVSGADSGGEEPSDDLKKTTDQTD